MSRKLSHHHFQAKGGAYTDIKELIRFRHAAKEIDSVTINRSSNPMAGLLSSHFRGRGIDFAEVRTYEPGDDVRSIDWKVTARTQIAHTKLFQEEKERPVLILVDQSQSMFFGSRRAFKSVVAAQLASLIAWISLENGDRVGGIVYSDSNQREIRPRRNKHAVLRLLHEIADFNQLLSKSDHPHNENYLADAIMNVRRVSKHGSTIFIISDFKHLNADAQLHLRQLSRHNEIIGLHISDDMEKELPLPDLYTITNGEQRIQIDTANSKERKRYQHDYTQKLEQLKTEFSKLKSPLFEFSTSDELVPTLASAYYNYSGVKR